MGPQQQANGNGSWTRWVLGFIITLIVAGMGAMFADSVNIHERMSTQESTTNSMQHQLDRIESKLDRALGNK